VVGSALGGGCIGPAFQPITGRHGRRQREQGDYGPCLAAPIPIENPVHHQQEAQLGKSEARAKARHGSRMTELPLPLPLLLFRFLEPFFQLCAPQTFVSTRPFCQSSSFFVGFVATPFTMASSLRGVLVLAALCVLPLATAQHREFYRWTLPESDADLVRRQTPPPGYHPEFGTCGSGTTCENACGENWLSCQASTDLSLFCYNKVQLNQTCCGNGSGRM
jgi:hypothetical protein